MKWYIFWTTIPRTLNLNLQFQFQTPPQTRGHEPERCYYDSLIIILTTLERCLSNQTKDTARFEEAMNVKLLLREICQFIGEFHITNQSQTTTESNIPAFQTFKVRTIQTQHH